METRHQLDFYGYRESNGFVPRYCRCIVPGVSLTLSKEDGNVITIAKDGGIMVSLGLETDGKMLYLVNLATGARIGGVEAPGANAVTDFSMNGTEDQLTVCVKHADGTLKNIVINMGNVIRAYTAGDGIDITDKTISVKLAQNGGLEFVDGGLAVDDDSVAMQYELDETKMDIEATRNALNGIGTMSLKNHTDINAISDDVSEIMEDIEELSGKVESFVVPEYSGSNGVSVSEHVVSLVIGDGLAYDADGKLYVSKSFDNVDVDTAIDSGSTNPVENRAIANALSEAERVVSSSLNDLNTRVNKNADDIMAISAATPSVSYPSAGDGLSYDQNANSYSVRVGSGLSIGEDGSLNAIPQTVDIDTELDATSTDPVTNKAITEAVDNLSEAVSIINNRLASSSAEMKTYVDNSFNAINERVEQLGSSMDGFATKDSVDELGARIDSLPDFSELRTEIASKADAADLDAVSDAVETAVQQERYNDDKAEQDAKINLKADAEALSELSDKLGAIVDFNNIKKTSGSSGGYVYDEPDDVAHQVKPFDHYYAMMHSMLNGGEEGSDESGFEGILWKLKKILDGVNDLDAVNRLLKNPGQ